MRAGLGARLGLVVGSGGGGGLGTQTFPPTLLLPFIQQLLQLQSSLQHAGKHRRPVVQVIWGGGAGTPASLPRRMGDAEETLTSDPCPLTLPAGI